jgi:type VI secretion system protein ImpC
MGGNVAPSLHHGHHVDAPCVARCQHDREGSRPMRDQRAEVSLHIAPDEVIEGRAIEPRAFRILVIGDFSARAHASATDTPRRVDRDDLDDHLARIAPRLRVTIDETPIDLAFTSMDDFLPDRLVARMSSLERTAPSGPATPAAVTPVTGGESGAPDPGRIVSGASLLDDMLDDVSEAPVRATRRTDELSAFVERAVAPHLVHAPDAETSARAVTEQETMTRRIRRVLHEPRVQSLEATWRALELLVRRLDTDGDLAVFLFDTAREDVAAALERLAQQRDASGDDQWALVISLHQFPEGEAGAETLARIAMAARALDAPFVAGAPASFAEETAAPPEVFTLIRQSLEARFLGLTFPRVLLRAPYGRDNPSDAIEFEELEDPEHHEDYLWGSGAVLVALLVGEAFNERGWATGPRMALDVGSLPLFMYKRGPETVAMSCAETTMSERVARHLLSRGLMPLAWIKNTDRVRLVELRSVSDPVAPLAASWASGSGGRDA